METKIIIGLFVGLLCGAVPFFIGFLLRCRLIGIVGSIVSILSGGLFNALDKPPFTALFVAAIFVVIIVSVHKRKSGKNKNYSDFDTE